MSVFLDANILFACSYKNSGLYNLFFWLKDSERFVSSGYAISEAEHNIRIKKPEWLETFLTVADLIEIVPEAELLKFYGLPEKDKPILDAAIAAKCAYLVTGDKRDFGHLFGRTVEGVAVISARDFTAVMLEKHKK